MFTIRCHTSRLTRMKGCKEQKLSGKEGKERERRGHKMKTEMKELNLNELEQVNGGFPPIVFGLIFLGAAAATVVTEVIIDNC